MSLIRRISNLFSRSRVDREIDAELRSHIEMRIEDNLAAGMTPEQARRAALVQFGNPAATREHVAAADAALALSRAWSDVRYAFRQMGKSPGFTVTAILTLALGIGAATAIFSLVNTVLLSPLPFPQADRLAWLEEQDHSLPGIVPNSLSYPSYFEWRAQTHTFDGLASYTGRTVTLKSNGQAQRLEAQVVSANFFAVLESAPLVGRDFRWDEERPGNRAVMLSYQLWQSAFGSAAGIAGQTIRLGDHSYMVAGVMPKEFEFPIEHPAPAMWLTLAEDADGDSPQTAQAGFNSLEIVGRLKPDVTVEQAKADMDTIAMNLSRQFPDSNKWFTSTLVEPQLSHMTGDTRPALRILFGAVTLLLLIACANVAGLLVARGSRRTAELALRAAIGASRGVIVRQLLVESVVLSVCSGVAGVAIAFGLLKGIVRLVPGDIPRIDHASLDLPVLAFVVGVSALTGLICGILPALRISRIEPSAALRGGGRGVTSGRGHHRLHNSLVVAQTAIGLVLLLGSGLLIRSFMQVLNVDPGFDPRHVLTARLGVPFDSYNHDRHLQFYDQVMARLRALPGVQAVAAGYPMPLSGGSIGISFAIEGTPVPKSDHPTESVGLATPGFFSTMGIPVKAGREFTPADNAKGAPVAMVNEAFARKYFSGENPLGRHMEADLGDGVVNHPVREIVGVVGDIKQKGLTAESLPEFYLPYAQAMITNPSIAIRGSADPATLQNAVRATVNEMDRDVPIFRVSTLEDYKSGSIAQPRFQTVLLTFFAAISLLLSALSLYGLLAYMVSQRRLEIGLRMAMGARRSDVLTMILGRALRLAGIGLCAGLAISAFMGRFLEKMLFGIHPFDVPTIAVTVLVLLAVSLIAGAAPAWRAAQLDPMQALRNE
jgi:predicted permease